MPHCYRVLIRWSLVDIAREIDTLRAIHAAYAKHPSSQTKAEKCAEHLAVAKKAYEYVRSTKTKVEEQRNEQFDAELKKAEAISKGDGGVVSVKDVTPVSSAPPSPSASVVVSGSVDIPPTVVYNVVVNNIVNNVLNIIVAERCDERAISRVEEGEVHRRDVIDSRFVMRLEAIDRKRNAERRAELVKRRNALIVSALKH